MTTTTTTTLTRNTEGQETLDGPLAAWNARRNSAAVPNRPRPLTKVRVTMDADSVLWVEGDNGTLRPVNHKHGDVFILAVRGYRTWRNANDRIGSILARHVAD